LSSRPADSVISPPPRAALNFLLFHHPDHFLLINHSPASPSLFPFVRRCSSSWSASLAPKICRCPFPPHLSQCVENQAIRKRTSERKKRKRVCALHARRRPLRKNRPPSFATSPNSTASIFPKQQELSGNSTTFRHHRLLPTPSFGPESKRPTDSLGPARPFGRSDNRSRVFHFCLATQRRARQKGIDPRALGLWLRLDHPALSTGTCTAEAASLLFRCLRVTLLSSRSWASFSCTRLPPAFLSALTAISGSCVGVFL
jgi:hypothetical protein